MHCAIRYPLYNLKNVENTHEGVLRLVNCRLKPATKSNTPPWVFFTFFKLYKWYQIAQSDTFTWSKSTTLKSVTSLWRLFCWFWTEFTHSSGVSIVDFKQVHAVCELFKTHFKAFVKCLEDKHLFLRSEWFFIKPFFQASRENFAQKLISKGKTTDLPMILVIKFYFLLRLDGHRLQW